MNILGYPLDRAAAILERAGYRVETVEARSRKGVEGDSKRVVRCLPRPVAAFRQFSLCFVNSKQTSIPSVRRMRRTLNQPIENTRLLQVLGLQQSCYRIF